MTLNVLLSAPQAAVDRFHPALVQAFADNNLLVDLRTDHPPGDVDYIVYAPNDTLTDFTPFRRTKAVLSLWAGVERIVQNKTLTQPLTRMVDCGLREGMVEWVTGHTLRHHLGMDRYILGESTDWVQTVPPLARNRTVGILGLGELGTACARALSHLGFDTAGWSRRPKTLDGVTCFHGADGLSAILGRSQILVLLLPLTANTENLMGKARFDQMPHGAFVLNPGRGGLIDDAALLAALDRGHIRHATLDVFRTEPLPPDSPFWAHPNITVTPHIASETRADTASQVIAENIRRYEGGKEMLFLVDRGAGY